MDNLETNNNTIDFLKFILSIFVVGIHAEIFGSEEIFISWFLKHWLFRIAVPFFFVTSGYYLGKKLWSAPDEEIRIVFSDYRRRLVPPLLLWGGIGLVIQSISLYRKGINIGMILLYDIRTAVFYPRNAMWFVWACIVASFIIQVFWKSKNFIVLGIAAVIGYFFALVCNTYYFAVERIGISCIVNNYMHYCISARNGIFVGLLFVLEGILISLDRVSLVLKNMSGRKCWSVFLVSELVFVCEICYSYKKLTIDDSSLFIIFPILIPLIVFLAIRYSMKIKLPYKILRKLSTSIYFMHRFILTIVVRFTSSQYIAFSIVVLSAVVIGLIVQKINKPILNKFVM